MARRAVCDRGETPSLFARIGGTGAVSGYLPFSEWANAPAAELAIVLGTTGQSDRMNGMADLLEKKFGIHAVKDMYPIGWENTCKWILEIGRLHKT